MLYIHPDECVDWGACEPVRAVEAIFCEDDVPDQWPQLTVENAKFFDQLGSPGGVAKTACCPATPSMSPTTSWSSIPWCPGPAVEGRRRER
jgi:hypothetical protein